MADAEYSPDKFSGSQVSGQEDSFSLKFLIGFVVILLLAATALGYYLYTRGVITLPFLQSLQTTSPAPSVQQPTPIPTRVTAFEDCTMTKEKDSLVETVGKDGAKTIGAFRGHITKLEVRDSVLEFELTSPKGEQIHTFNIQFKDDLFYDALNSVYVGADYIKVGHTLAMSFECIHDSADKSVKITRIAILGKLLEP